MYKIIFIDLDGTLLNDKKEISNENIKQLNRVYNEKGIKTIITSGRQVGYIKNIKTNEYLSKDFFEIDDVKFLRNIYLNSDLKYFLIYTENNSYIEKRIDMKTHDKIVVNNITEFIECNNLNPVIGIFGGDVKSLEGAIKQLI